MHGEPPLNVFVKYRSTHWLPWIIRETASANDLGLISICTRNREKFTAEVGFILLEAYKGKGYATEAVKTIIDFAADAFGFKKTAACIQNLPGTFALSAQSL